MAPDDGRLHVLAYDDDPAIRSVYRELLGDEGYRVTLAATPLADPADVAALRPDLVVVDLMAGREEIGPGFIARLKTHPATRNLPVLICSGDAVRLAAMRPTLDAWGCAVIEKPFDIDAFVWAVRSCLGVADGGDDRRAGDGPTVAA